MKTKTLFPFLALTFGLSWSISALLFMFYDQIVAIFGELGMTNPLFILKGRFPRHCRHIPGLAALRSQRPEKFLPAADFLASPGRVVVVPLLHGLDLLPIR